MTLLQSLNNCSLCPPHALQSPERKGRPDLRSPGSAWRPETLPPNLPSKYLPGPRSPELLLSSQPLTRTDPEQAPMEPLLLSSKDQWKELSREDLDLPPEHVPPPPRPPKRTLEPHNGKCKELFSSHQWVSEETCGDEDSLAREEGRAQSSAMHSVSR